MKTVSFIFVVFFASTTLSVSANDLPTKINKPNSSIINNNAVIYDSLNLQQYGLSKKVFDLALKGWQKLKSAGRVINENIISIVDFSQPSNKKRLYIIDLANAQLLFNTYVAHGKRSGKDVATRFSNRPRSLESSVGFYVTADPYIGSNGYSLRLNGMEYGFNNNASRREIVLHGADYVSEEYISANGCLGRSWGCPAVPAEQSRDIIDSIKNGSCLFIYSPQVKYLKGSKVLNGKSV
ncbi:MAG: murein L,D-transpeptidase catalytic domain family protein [Bacteroidetes bacterium]|nr:murein L,D-transpeptidase catalytic domain family protein [Bacteroidota bacterium]